MGATDTTGQGQGGKTTNTRHRPKKHCLFAVVTTLGDHILQFLKSLLCMFQVFKQVVHLQAIHGRQNELL